MELFDITLPILAQAPAPDHPIEAPPPPQLLPRRRCRVLEEKALKGTIPPGGWALPPTLIRLSLFNNLLHGSIPADFSAPPQLRVLELTGNMLTSTLPPIQLPPSLEYLGLYFNWLSGTIPEDWELPESLQNLALAWNDLTGESTPAGQVLEDPPVQQRVCGIHSSCGGGKLAGLLCHASWPAKCSTH